MAKGMTRSLQTTLLNVVNKHRPKRMARKLSESAKNTKIQEYRKRYGANREIRHWLDEDGWVVVVYFR
jgi:hypothetical protein